MIYFEPRYFMINVAMIFLERKKKLTFILLYNNVKKNAQAYFHKSIWLNILHIVFLSFKQSKVAHQEMPVLLIAKTVNNNH